MFIVIYEVNLIKNLVQQWVNTNGTKHICNKTMYPTNDYINRAQQSNPRNGMIIEVSVKEVNHFVDKVFKMNMLIFGLYYCLYYYVFWSTSVTNTTINT